MLLSPGESITLVADLEVAEPPPAGPARVAYTRSGHGWILQGSYVFDPPFELVGRVSRLYALSGTAPAFISEVDTRGLEIAAGANYYFNDHKLKLQADWIARMPPGAELGRADHVVHLQLDITM